MDIKHWQKLYMIDFTIVYLAPKGKWDEIIKIRDYHKYGLIYYMKNGENKLFFEMTRQEIIEQLYPETFELLMDPEYDLK